MLGRPRTLPDKVVQRIVRERAKGRTWMAIADGLNADRVATAQGGLRWYPATVRSVASQRRGGSQVRHDCHDGSSGQIQGQYPGNR